MTTIERYIIKGPTQYYVRNAIISPEWNTDPGRANLFTSEKIAQAVLYILEEANYKNLTIHKATLTIHNNQ